jgi:hypothetical protein
MIPAIETKSLGIISVNRNKELYPDIIRSDSGSGVVPPQPEFIVSGGGEAEMKGKGYNLFHPEGSTVVNGRFLLADGKWYPKTTGCRTMADAKKEVPRIAKELSNAHSLPLPFWHPEYKAEEKDDGLEDNDSKSFGGSRSVVEVSKRVLARRIKEGRWKSPHIYENALEYMEKGFGEHAKLPPKKLTRAAFVKLREFLIDCEDIAKSASEYGRRICQVLVLVPGINPDFIKILRRLPKNKGDGEKGDQFQESQLRTILVERKAEQDEITQILIEIGLDDGPQIIDAACMPLSGINFESGFICYRRVKSREEARFQAGPRLLELLRARKERLRPGAVYLFEELMFTKKQRRDPKCNTTEWDDIPASFVTRASVQAGNRIRKFLRERCKFTSDRLSFKSFRIGRISFWASVGFTLKTRMRMAGHASVQRHTDYDRGSEVEIRRASEVSWKYYEAIEQGLPFFVPTTPYDLYEFIKTRWDALPELVRAAMSTVLGGSFSSLERVVQAAFAAQNAHMDQRLDAQAAILEELSRSVARSHAILVKLADRLGLSLPDAA